MCFALVEAFFTRFSNPFKERQVFEPGPSPQGVKALFSGTKSTNPQETHGWIFHGNPAVSPGD